MPTAGPFDASDAAHRFGWPWREPMTLDWQDRRVVVFESDDWGSCEAVRSADELPMMRELRRDSPWLHGTLESPEDLAWLDDALASVPGRDGLPACFTAFLCVANPDYQAIRAERFQRYHEIPVDRGVPAGWERGDLPGKWRECERHGTFAFEYHTRLHHTQPETWLARLRADGPEGERARRLFDRHGFVLGGHLPEYENMTARQQHEWVRGGVAHFTRTLGRAPAAAVTSDAMPVTEAVWAVQGIRTFCLKHSRLNSGEVVAYHTKPWNSQDIYCPMGGYNAALDMVYLGRNVQFECGVRADEGQSADAALSAMRAAWARNEPAIVNTHRINYVSVAPEMVERGRGELTRLLHALAAHQPHFLTSAEVGDLYRQGYSVRAVGNQRVVRNWSAQAVALSLDDTEAQVVSLPEGREVQPRPDGAGGTVELPPGDYRVALSQPLSEAQVRCAPV